MTTRQQAHEGHPWLVGSVWGFGAETAVHALRLMGSGLFDEYPKLRIILGHLGEGVPFSIWRVDHRVSKMANANLQPKTKLPISEYLNICGKTNGEIVHVAPSTYVSDLLTNRPQPPQGK